MNNVRAKFFCASVTKIISGARNLKTGQYEQRPVFAFKFYPVTSGSKENEKFYASTPSGNLELTAIRDYIFEIGQEYYLDFSLAKPQTLSQ